MQKKSKIKSVNLFALMNMSISVNNYGKTKV